MVSVNLIPITSYEVVTPNGKSLGTFTKDSEWEGFIKLKGETGSLVVSDDGPLIPLIPIFKEAEHKAIVITASPDLVAALKVDNQGDDVAT